jgi:hypothetical protein
LLSLIVSTAAYFIASHYIKRYLDGIDAPAGFTRSVLTFCAAAMVAYSVAFVVDWAGDLNDKHAFTHRLNHEAAGNRSNLRLGAHFLT